MSGFGGGGEERVIRQEVRGREGGGGEGWGGWGNFCVQGEKEGKDELCVRKWQKYMSINALDV